MSGLSVFQFNQIKDFIKENIPGVKDDDIEFSLTLLDALKSGRLHDGYLLDIEQIAQTDVDDIGDITPIVTCVDVFPKEAIWFILNKIHY